MDCLSLWGEWPSLGQRFVLTIRRRITSSKSLRLKSARKTARFFTMLKLSVRYKTIFYNDKTKFGVQVRSETAFIEFNKEL